MDDAVELADMIWHLRSELTRAMWGGEGKDLRFRAETVELELAVVLEKVKDPKIGVKFWVLDTALGARRSAGTTQTIKLVMHPVRGDAPDDPVLIDDHSLPNED